MACEKTKGDDRIVIEWIFWEKKCSLSNCIQNL